MENSRPSISAHFDMIGDKHLMNLDKIAFLASKSYSDSDLNATIKWARGINNHTSKNTAIVSGFQSPLECKALEILLDKSHPVIWVLANSIFDEVPFPFQAYVEQGRLLIISPFRRDIKNASRTQAVIRNCLVIDMAQQIVVGALSENGMLEKILEGSLFQKL